jgi:hypothetical protein
MCIRDSVGSEMCIRDSLFVAILKIGHVRPFRRRLILETEFKG